MSITSLREKIRQHIVKTADKVGYETLAKEIDVPYWWLYRFGTMRIMNPSAERLEKARTHMMKAAQ